MNIYQINISVRYIEPLAWWRFLVKADTRLGELHDIHAGLEKVQLL